MMRVAIAIENGMVSAHFGHCEGFTVYEVNKGKKFGSQFIANPGHTPGFLPLFLIQADVDVVIAGGMGERAQALFTDNGITVFTGAEGNCDDVIEKYLAGKLVSSGVVCTEHQNNCEEH